MAIQAERARVVRIFVSSPRDVAEERESLDEVVSRINQTLGQSLGVRLEVWKWETDVVPRIGPPPQTVVDEQTPPYGVYLGILATRFGTPTGKHGSGTEKEFRDALKDWSKHGTPWILFYFSDTPLPPSRIDPKQYAKVNRFRRELEQMGITASYVGVRGQADAFFEKVDTHLRKLVEQHFRKKERAPAGRRTTRAVTTSQRPSVPPAYREWLEAQCAEIELLGLRLKQGQAVRLNNVYVPLTTPVGEAEKKEDPESRTFRGPSERERPQLLLDMLGKQSLYVSGLPGSGKSTFCRWIAWLACLGKIPSQIVEAPEGFTESVPDSLRERLPLLVRLRDFWMTLPGGPSRRELSGAELGAALRDWVETRKPGGLGWPTLQAHLQGGSGLLIFDGVDEVPLSHGDARQPYAPREMLLAGLAAAIPEWVKRGSACW